MKILSILGARPQFIKAAALERLIYEKYKDKIESVLVHTGQHFDSNMSDVFFNEMEIPKPKYNLSINNLSHGSMTGRMIEEIENILFQEKPDWVIIYGDTNSTLAGAIAAKKINIKIAHIEAGMRNYDETVPEEVNRIVADRVSDVLFCFTNAAKENLVKEGYLNLKKDLLVSGDIMLDSFNYFSNRNNSQLEEKYEDILNEKFVYSTIHRAVNTDDPERLKNIIKGLNEINKKYKVYLPLHPRTRKKIEELKDVEIKFKISDPVGYAESNFLLNKCSLVVTDSGGLQREAYFGKKKCMLLLEKSTWRELEENKKLMCVNPKNDSIIDGFNYLLDRDIDFSEKFFGDGNCAKFVADYLIENSND